MPKLLSQKEIERLASRPKARRIAVENFLSSLDLSLSKFVHRTNLCYDARLYGWNAATFDAILEGINLAYQV